MYKVLENVSEKDPLNNPAQKSIIDGIINENRALPGATMVILNDLQNKLGFISEPMQAYVAS